MKLLDSDKTSSVIPFAVKIILADTLDPIIANYLRAWLLNILYRDGATTATRMKFR